MYFFLPPRALHIGVYYCECYLYSFHVSESRVHCPLDREVVLRKDSSGEVKNDAVSEKQRFSEALERRIIVFSLQNNNSIETAEYLDLFVYLRQVI